jgi:uncharacterized protein YbjT (DUF2867 family)
MAHILIAGATGFLGRNLSAALLARGHRVRTLVRLGSEDRVTPGCDIVFGDPLDRLRYRRALSEIDTLVQLVGVSHPSPAKAALFRSVDLNAAQAAIEAGKEAAVRHLVYVSVAHPAPLMKAYIAVRSHAEGMIRASGLNATILRPWYVLGPGRRWPLFLLPVYGALGILPWTRDAARRLGLVTVEHMIDAMVRSVEEPPAGIRILEVPEIRSGDMSAARAFPVRQGISILEETNQ